MADAVQTLAQCGDLRRFGDSALPQDSNGSYCFLALFFYFNGLVKIRADFEKRQHESKVRKKILLPRKIT
jgi:hypothetical protein